jgi:hypothetical protein
MPLAPARLIQSLDAHKLTLRLPRQDEEKEFLCAHRVTSPEGPYFLHCYKEGRSFSRYLEVLAETGARFKRSTKLRCIDFCLRIGRSDNSGVVDSPLTQSVS